MKFKHKQNTLIIAVLVAILAGACIGIVYHNKAQARPDARLSQAVELIQQGKFDDAREYTNTSSYFSALDLIGEDGTNTQREKIANAMYKDLQVSPNKVIYNKKGTKAIVTTKVSNYDVYSAALQVTIPASEAQKNSESENRKLLVEKATKSIGKFKSNKKNKKKSQTVRFTMVREDGKWVVDGNDSENQLSLLSFIGVRVEDIEKDQPKQSKPKKKATMKKRNDKKNTKENDKSAQSKNKKDDTKKEIKKSSKKNPKISDKKSNQKSSKNDSITKNKKANTKSDEKNSKSDSKDNEAKNVKQTGRSIKTETKNSDN